MHEVGFSDVACFAPIGVSECFKIDISESKGRPAVGALKIPPATFILEAFQKCLGKRTNKTGCQWRLSLLDIDYCGYLI